MLKGQINKFPKAKQGEHFQVACWALGDPVTKGQETCVFHLTADVPRCLHKCGDSGNQVYHGCFVGRVTPAHSYLANVRAEIAKYSLRTLRDTS